MRFAFGTIAPLLIAGIIFGACSSEGVLGSFPSDAPDSAAPEGTGDGGPEFPPDGSITVTPATAAIGAGGASTCAMDAKRRVVCWGEAGSLGIGDTDIGSSAEYRKPIGLGAVSSVSGGERSQCAIADDGKAYCWGSLYVGEQPSYPGDVLPVLNPTPYATVGDLARIAVGRYFLCFLGKSGDLRCSGQNGSGQLGVGSTASHDLPTPVGGFDGKVTSVSASMGGVFVCATTSLGSIYCWGEDPNGNITGKKGSVTTPRRVEDVPERALDVVAGGSHACARLESGRVVCWGDGEDGQLGDGARTSSARPTPVKPLTDIIGLAAGSGHTCAVHSEGSIWCWGKNDTKQVGDVLDESKPTLIVDADFEARYVTCGLAHTCAWATGAQIKCWGDNKNQQLGPK